jgi:arylsulfatase A-like enzyme
MKPRISFFTSLTLFLFSTGLVLADHHEKAKPNVIFIMADDLGYGDLGCFGQTKIKTPRLDQMATEGMKLTQFYAGTTVCAPSRCVLMTGQHTGRCWVRGNAGADNIESQALRDEDKTIVEVFKDAGYATALFGKWGLGEATSSGHPNNQGFDICYGYLNQHHAHNYYPTFLYKNKERVSLRNVPEWENSERGEGWARERIDYTHDLIHDQAEKWLDENYKKPFFLYLSYTIPHANNEGTRGTGDGQDVPDYGIYEDKDWSRPNKGQAAMITRMDRDIGSVLDKLKEHKIAKNTLVIFTSDNGPHREGGNDPEFFDANGPLQGLKRTLTEGGIRVPTLAWWPGHIDNGSVSAHIGYFGDVMATVCELTKQPIPDATQSISFLPALLGQSDKQKTHDYLYWEFYEQGSRQAVRFGDWKAIREPMLKGKVALYDLSKDIGETNDLAKKHPDLVKKAVGFMEEAHRPDPKWKIRGGKKQKG